MRVLIAETDQHLARERAEQLQMDGHHTSLALTSHAAALKPAELPDALVLCNLGGPVQTIGLLRALRGRGAPRLRLEPARARRPRRQRPRPGPLLRRRRRHRARHHQLAPARGCGA